MYSIDDLSDRRYVVFDITDTGRHDVRGTSRQDRKYDGLRGSIVTFRHPPKQYEPMEWNVHDSMYYEWWTTSALLELSYDEINHALICETYNTIYELRELVDDGR